VPQILLINADEMLRQFYFLLHLETYFMWPSQF